MRKTELREVKKLAQGYTVSRFKPRQVSPPVPRLGTTLPYFLFLYPLACGLHSTYIGLQCYTEENKGKVPVTGPGCGIGGLGQKPNEEPKTPQSLMPYKAFQIVSNHVVFYLE